MDPLSELRDIHLPTDPSWWPPAIGWWLVGAAVLLLGLGVAWWVRNAQRRRYRRALWALRLLRDDPTLRTDDRAYVTAIARLLRRYALAQFGRPAVAGLAGNRWAAFLRRTGGPRAFTDAELALLGEAAYRPDLPDVDRRALTDHAFAWLRAVAGRGRV